MVNAKGAGHGVENVRLRDAILRGAGPVRLHVGSIFECFLTQDGFHCAHGFAYS